MKIALAGCAVGIIAVVSFWGLPALGGPSGIVSAAQASGDVSITDTKSQDSTVSGVVVNKSRRPVRDVQLMIRHEWFWKHERRPGSDSPSRADVYTVRGEIPPGGTLPFTYQTSPPLPVRSDGQFKTSVEVVRFTKLGE